MKDGFLFIDKPVDWTSRDVCNKISHLLNTKKVGHTGTLDPFATGLLIVAIGSASKFIPFLEDLDKTYIAELQLGTKTNTADKTGEIIEEKPIPSFVKEDIEKVFESFIGESMQIPPMTSAIHVDGKKLYELAHKGIEIERKPRKINIHELKLISFENDKIVFLATVSKGTYIRTLGEDIANKLGTVGHLTELRRTRISKYLINDAITIEKVNEKEIIPISVIADKVMKIVEIDITYISKVKNGVSFEKSKINNSGEDIILLIDKISKDPLAIYKLENGMYKCLRGLWHENN